MRPARSWAVAAALFGLTTLASAQQPAAPPPCSSPEHRQFDFWIGDWDVQGPDGKPIGTNKVEKILNGCVLQENWHGTDGDRGSSFNIYNAINKRWHQTWVSDSGNLLQLDGTLQDGRMVLSGDRKSPQGAMVKNRITWTRVDADHVRQEWAISLDDGKTWRTDFSGLYVRRKQALPSS